MKERISVILFIIGIMVCCNNPPAENTINISKGDSISIKSISRNIRNNPKNAELFSKRATMYWQMHRTDSAINDASIAYRLDSLNEKYALEYAEYLFKSVKTNDAISLLIRYLNNKKERVAVVTRIAQYYLYLKDYRQAKEYIDKAFLINSQFPEAHFIKGMFLVENNKPNDAIKAFQSVIMYDPNYYEAYIMLGLLSQELNDSLALQYYKTASQLKPNEPQPYYNMGYYYQENGKYDKAFEMYNYILRHVDKKYSNAYFNQGYIYMRYLKNYQKALAYFDSVLFIEPDRVEAVYNKGYCFEMMNDYTSARSMFIKAKSIIPNYQLAIDGLNRLDKKTH